MGRKEIISKGKTIEDALEEAIKSLGTTREDVDYEVIDEGKEGLLKFMGKPAVVKVMLKSEENKHTFSKEQEEEPSAEADQMLIAVVDKALMVEQGEGAVEVQIPEEMKFYLNDTWVSEDVVQLSSEDDFRYELKEEIEDTKWSVKMDAQKVNAILTVEPGLVRKLALEEQPPTKKLKIKLKVYEEPNLTLTIDEIKAELEKQKIVFGIDKDEMLKACSSKNAGEFVIAKGLEPEDGENGWFEFKVEINEDKQFVEREDGTIDFRNARTIPSVEEGAIIGEIHDPKEGKPGKSVMGQEIPPKPVRPLQLRTGKGATLLEDSKTVEATSWGRPTVETRGTSVKVEVLPKLEHSGNVDLSSGNLNFVGDIEIKGNVEDGMKVKATGDVEVRGTTSKSNVVAGKSATFIGNIIESKVSAGQSNKLIVEKAPVLEEMIEKIELLLKSINQLVKAKTISEEQLEKNGVFSIVKVLTAQKLEGFPNKVREFHKEIIEEDKMFDDTWVDLAEKLQQVFVMKNPKSLSTLQDLETLIESIRSLHEHTILPPDDPANITFASALNSEIYCSGNVTLVKRGCYNSVIYAGGFLKMDGFAKSGRIFAGKGAEIKEVGSKGGAPTIIITPKNQTIKIGLAMADTTLQVGRQKLQLVKDEYEIEAHLGEDGLIRLRK